MSETYIEIETVTWSKDTHSLFDYDSTSNFSSKFLVWDTGAVLRSNTTCKYSLQTPLPPEEPLLYIRRRNDRFLIYSNTQGPVSELWSAIKLTSNDGYSLKEGDQIKLGRIKLQVKKISKGTDETVPPVNDRLLCEDLSEREKDATCRICCCEEENKQDPLITPCNCSGSVKYIHVSCIKKWLESKINCRSTSRVFTYNWTDLSCELCKASFPQTLIHYGKKFDLISVNTPKGPHMMLEEIKEEGSKVVYLIDLQNSNAVIGRGHDCDIRLGDISVSRKHAKIYVHGGKFLIKDYGSKFGTLVNTDGDMVLEKDKLVGIQVGRTLVKLRCRVKSNCWIFCCETESPKVNRHGRETDPHSPISYRFK